MTDNFQTLPMNPFADGLHNRFGAFAITKSKFFVPAGTQGWQTSWQSRNQAGLTPNSVLICFDADPDAQTYIDMGPDTTNTLQRLDQGQCLFTSSTSDSGGLAISTWDRYSSFKTTQDHWLYMIATWPGDSLISLEMFLYGNYASQPQQPPSPPVTEAISLAMQAGLDKSILSAFPLLTPEELATRLNQADYPQALARMVALARTMKY